MTTPKTYRIENLNQTLLAARLADILTTAFPGILPTETEAELVIRPATVDDPGVPRMVQAEVPDAPESFAIRADERMVHLVGRDTRGLKYAVEALAERLGIGQYLAFDTPSRKMPSHPEEWNSTDEPLARRRILFNWHNFLSGCSSWDKADWLNWIDQGLKLRFNAVMAHCYSNSPMLEAEINGVKRPVGWLSTSVKGRDWGTQHANDARRIPGARPEDGPPLFDGAAFGAEAGLVSDDRRAAAMKALMDDVFNHARERDMDVYLAVDVDCQTDYPAAVLDTLPAEARIEVRTPLGTKAFVHPGHPDGLAVYRQMIQSILSDFPQITHLVAWFRGKESEWGLLAHLAPENMPEEWREEYRRLEPDFSDAMRLNALARPPYLFALAKILSTFKDILKDLGREDVELLSGTWDLHSLSSFHFFVDRSIPLIALDYEIRFEHTDFHQAVSGVSDEREIVPILWAHHDDHSYIGRSYVPVPRLHTRLRDLGVDSFGVIHWTTRPLDLYFKSTCRQIWRASRNEQLETTVRRMAEDLFGEANASHLTDYLYLWVTTSSFFGVETGQRFMSDYFKPFEDPAQQILLAQTRLNLLENLPAPGALDEAGRDWLGFYRDAERFLIAFQSCFDAMLRVEDLPVEEAGELLADRDPRDALRAYANHIRHGETTKGEQGTLYSMATRWWVYYEEARQICGLIPIRITFEPTHHDSLATLPGRHTFFFELDGTPWLQRGEHETGERIIALPGNTELEAHGVDLSNGVNLPIAAWFESPLRVPPGQITLKLAGSENPVSFEWRDAKNRMLESGERKGGSSLEISVPRGSTGLRIHAPGRVMTHAWFQPESIATGNRSVDRLGPTCQFPSGSAPGLKGMALS